MSELIVQGSQIFLTHDAFQWAHAQRVTLEPNHADIARIGELTQQAGVELPIASGGLALVLRHYGKSHEVAGHWDINFPSAANETPFFAAEQLHFQQAPEPATTKGDILAQHRTALELSVRDWDAPLGDVMTAAALGHPLNRTPTDRLLGFTGNLFGFGNAARKDSLISTARENGLNPIIIGRRAS